MGGERVSGGFGGMLRDARERRGVSLRHIANTTKISFSALEALERNDISRLPGGIFSRAFVRSYAVEVGLDPDRTIQQFITQFPSDTVTAGHSSRPIEDHQAIASEKQTASTILRLVLISVPVALAMIYLATAGRRFLQTADPPAAVESSAPAHVERATPAPATHSDSVVPVAAGTVLTSPPPSVAPTAGEVAALTLDLTASRPCWVSATVDGRKAVERLLKPGETRTLAATREIVLTAGDAGALSVTINGAAAKPLGGSGQVVTRRLSPDNLRDYLQAR